MVHVKVVCVGMKGVDINKLTDPLLTRHLGSSYLKNLGMSLGRAKFQFFERGKKVSELFTHMWRMHADSIVMRAMFPRYIVGANILIIIFKDTKISTFSEMNELIRITREQWGDIPIFLIADLTETRKGSRCNFDEAYLHRFYSNHKCTDLLYLSREENIDMENLFINILGIYDAMRHSCRLNVGSDMRDIF
ncbi:MAG: hypothetical protein GF364_13655 [Candidatus Lokiarchaeota archaeon]|nr:hypothetical protein [Candidatus Lokiarchaeota archaeon]